MGNDKKRKPDNQQKVQQAVEAFVNRASLQNDPNGSYTGQPSDKGEKPVQDADDL